MNTQYYKVMPIDVLPEEEGLYMLVGEHNEKELAQFFQGSFCDADGFVIDHIYKYWLKPITLTLQELLSTEEGKEIVMEVFNALSELNVFGKEKYPTADDFIKTNIHDSSK
jgi:hypothetical protein